eukprot:scaffold300855_cov22-Tisochrysis_lutea.AAC.3
MDPASPLMRETEFYTSHEALLLDYEESLTRLDSTTGGWHVSYIGTKTCGHALVTSARFGPWVHCCVRMWAVPNEVHCTGGMLPIL